MNPKNIVKWKNPDTEAYILLLLFFNIYLFLRSRDRAWAGEGQREETKSEAGPRLWAISIESDMGRKLTSQEIMSWAKWATQVLQKHTYILLISCICSSRTDKTHPCWEKPKQWLVRGGGSKGEWTRKVHEGTLRSNWNILDLDLGVS